MNNNEDILKLLVCTNCGKVYYVKNKLIENIRIKCSRCEKEIRLIINKAG